MLKRLFILFVLLATLAPGLVFAVDGLLASVPGGGGASILSDTTLLTDAATTITKTVYSGGVKNLVVDVTADKGCTVVMTPLLADANGPEGKASDSGTIADGGASGRFRYTGIASPYVKVVVTKTEAGDMTDFLLVVSGD